MLVEAQAIEAQTLHLIPDLEMLLIGARSHLGVKMLAGQGIGQITLGLGEIEMAVVCQ